MAKKTAPALANVASPVKICFERIIPEELDPEQHIRRTMRQMAIAARGKPLSAAETAHVARMAVIDSKKWEKGRMLRCRFLDGSAKMKKKVEQVAHRWEAYAN